MLKQVQYDVKGDYLLLARKRHLRRYFCLENSHLRNANSYFKGYKNA
jgi:hypothetical protein